MNEIIVKHGKKKELINLLNVTRLTIDRALLGITNTDLAQMIRKKALELGGVEKI